MNETNKTPVWKLIFLIAEAAIEFSAAVAAFFLSARWEGDKRYCALISASAFIICLIISLISIIRYKKEKEGIIALCVGIQIFVLVLALTAMKFLNGFSVGAMLIWAAGVISELALIFVYRKTVSRNDDEGETPAEPAAPVKIEIPEIKAPLPAAALKKKMYAGRANNLIFDASAVSEKVTDEYCLANEKTREQLGEYDKLKIKIYASTPVSYLFMWAARNGHLSRSLLDCTDINPLLDDTADPAEFIREKLECQVSLTDFSEDIKEFIMAYYQKDSSGGPGNGRKYENDYYIQIRNPWKIFYCIDFSMDIYAKLSETIGEAFRHHCIRRQWQNSGLMNNEKYDEKRHSETFNQDIIICKAPEVYGTYADKCIRQVCEMPDFLVEDLSSKLVHFANTGENTIRYAKSRLRIIDRLHSGRMIIPPPYGEEPAYILVFDADFLMEGKVCIVFRDDEVVNVTESADAQSPWDQENELNYSIIKSLKLTNVRNIDALGKALRSYSDGSLEQTVVVPEFTGAPVPDENRLFVPQPVAEYKNRCDIIAEKMLNDGAADRYECIPVYREGSFVPSDVAVALYKGAEKVFSSEVSVW